MSRDKPSTDPGASSEKDEGLRPTVIKVPAAGERTRNKNVPPPPAAVNDATSSERPMPTTVPGVRRERIVVTSRELRALSPGASAATSEAAVRLIEAFPAGKVNERKAVLWGHELQKSYGDKVTGTLALVQDPLVEQARNHVARVLEILGAIDLVAVCGHDRNGLFGGLARSMNTRVDSPSELAVALDELQLLLHHMGNAIDKLLALASRLRQHATEIGQIESEMEAAALAALFLSNHFSSDASELAQRFTDRAMSLTATVAQVRQSDSIHRVQIEQPLQLIGTIQNVALVTLPGFIASLSALLTLARTKGASPTEARDMSYRLRDVLFQLKI